MQGRKVERITSRDLDGDGTIGPALTPREPMQVEVIERRETGRVKRMLYLDLGISDDQTPALGRGLTSDKPLSQGAWTGSGNPLSRSQFDRVRDNLIARGLARWVDPKARSQGTELTPAGRAVMRRIVEQSRASTWRGMARTVIPV